MTVVPTLSRTVTMTTTTDARRDQDELQRCVERIVADVCSGESVVGEVRRERSQHSTSYHTHVLTTRLASGRELRIFLKDFGRSLRPKDHARERRERELRVYQDLLVGTALGAARYYGSLWDESRGRCWLLLEFVDGTPVGHCDFDAWAPALAGLGRLHGHFATRSDRLRAHDFLIRYGAEFLWATAELATAAVAQVTPHLGERLADLVGRYGPAVDVVASWPPTLVHGGCGPTNILVRVADDPSRVCIIDWEEAGLGVPLYDVAWLLDGVQPPVQGRLLDVYRQEAIVCGLSLPAPKDTVHVLDCVRLHRTINWLSRALAYGYGETDVAKLIAIAEQIGRQVLGRHRGAPRPRAPAQGGGADATATAGRASAPTSGETSFARVLERVLRDARGAPVRVTDVRREPSPFATLFPAEVVRVALASGEHIALFVKHLGSEQSDHPEKQRRDREIRVYEELLTEHGLPVPGFYGSRRNPESGRCELFLEYVDDWNLKYHDLREWYRAARRLGDLHAHFAARAAQLSACDFLLRFDDAYVRAWADRALAAVADRSAELAARLRRVVDRYDQITQVLTRYPPTLVHNDLAPKNVIACRATDPSRICFVDWEMAGVGCGALDLVDLAYGLDAASAGEMRAAYCQAVAGAGLLPASARDREALFAAAELHKTVYRVAHAASWGVATERVAQWVADAELLLARARGSA